MTAPPWALWARYYSDLSDCSLDLTWDATPYLPLTLSIYTWGRFDELSLCCIVDTGFDTNGGIDYINLAHASVHLSDNPLSDLVPAGWTTKGRNP